MPWPLKTTYREGQSLKAVPAADLNTIGNILNDLTAIGLKLTRTASGLGWKLELLLDGVTLAFDTDNQTLKVKDLGIGTGQLAAAAVDKTKLAADVAGAALTQAAGGELDVAVDNATIEVSGDALRVKAGGIGASHLGANAVGTAAMDTSLPSGTMNCGLPGNTLTIVDGLITAGTGLS